jgi:hypothetical protein
VPIAVNAQETPRILPKATRKRKRFFTSLANLHTIKEWLGGGTSNIKEFGLNTFSIIKNDVVWDNKFILAYGLSKIKR